MSNKTLFDHCDLFITTDHDWSFVMANPDGQAAVDLMFDPPLDWDCGSEPLQSVFPNAPSEWRAVDLSVQRSERAGKAKLLPRIEGHHKTFDRNTLRIATGAQQTAPDLRIIVYDARHPTGNGYAYFNTTDEEGAVTGGFPMPSLPPLDNLRHANDNAAAEVSFQNGQLGGGRNVLERIIATGKPEAVRFNYDDGGPSKTSPNVTADHGKQFISAFPPSALPKLNGTDWLKEYQPAREAELEKATFPTGLPLFELSPSICGTLSAKDRAAMIADMIEADVLHLPFPEIAVRFWVPDVLPGRNELRKFLTFTVSGALSVHPVDPQLVTPETIGDVFAVDQRAQRFKDGDGIPQEFSLTIDRTRGLETDSAATMCMDALTMLLLALATRNVARRTETNTRIKNKHKESKPQFKGPQGAVYISTTRLEAPAAEDMEQEHGTHGSPRPHMRRGHAHTVTFGIGRRERRVQWFPAVWVNGAVEGGNGSRKYVVQQGAQAVAS